MLDGFTIIEVARSAPVRASTALLRDFGASIVAVHMPDNPAIDSRDGKTHRYLDLKSPEGQHDFLDLVASSHGLIEGLRPGALDRLGLQQSRIAVVNPRLVRVSLTAFGQEGPYARLPAYDLVLQGLGGILPTDASGEPTLPSSVWADRTGALSATIAMIVGLLGASRTGTGHWLDTALLDQVIAGGAESDPMLRGHYPCYNVYRCSDGRYITLALRGPQFWAQFCRNIGKPEWEAEQTPDADHAATMIAELRDIIGTRTQREWLALLQEWELPGGPVHRSESLGSDPHLASRYGVQSAAFKLVPPRLVGAPSDQAGL